MKQAYLDLSYTKYVGFFQDAAEKFSRSDVQVWPSFLSVEVNGHEAWHVICWDWKNSCRQTRNYSRWRFGQVVEWWQNDGKIILEFRWSHVRLERNYRCSQVWWVVSNLYLSVTLTFMNHLAKDAITKRHCISSWYIIPSLYSIQSLWNLDHSMLSGPYFYLTAA